MDLLLLFLFSPAILAQGYGKGDDPNDEPFLPIYPVYPYSPKLIKRGVEKEAVAQLSPEMYAPKVDAKDSYSAGYNANYPRDSSYPNYNPYTKVSSPSNYGYYTTVPSYSYPTAAYNSYSSHYTVPPPTYAAIPYASYPNYYYQPPYYYPNYYSQPLLPPPPSPPSATDYSTDPYSSAADADGDKAGKTDGDNKSYGDTDADRFVDGGNFVTANAKDLDGQSSMYKTRSPQNQLVRGNDPGTKNFAIPVQRATYRLINVAGQPVTQDYSLPTIYAKAQHLEELMNHAWPKLVAQNLPTTARYPTQESDVVENEQSKEINKSRYAAVSKAGLAYIVNPNLFGKLNVGRSMGQGATTRLKSVKYPSMSQGAYATIEKPEQDRQESGEYESYEGSPGQGGNPDYDGSASQTEKLQQNYENEATQAASYHGQNYVTAQTPRGYDYSYRNYEPQRVMDQQQRYKYNLDDVNFGAKTKKV